MKKVLVTGANGFVGKNLSEFLFDSGCSVDALIRNISLTDELLQNKITHFYSYDNLPDFNNYDCIIHTAGKAHDVKNISSPEEYFLINTELTKKLYDIFLSSSCKKFIYFSSVKAITDTPNEVLTEDILANPQTVYGKSKLLAEQYIIAHHSSLEQNYYILRPCLIHGKGNKGNLNTLYKMISKGIPYPLAAFENKRSFLSIDNLSFIIHQLVENNLDNNIFNVADDEALSTNDLIRVIAESLQKKPALWHINKKLIKNIAKMGDFLGLPFNSDRLQKLTENYEVSNKRLIRTLNISLPLKSREALLKTFRSFAI